MTNDVEDDSVEVKDEDADEAEDANKTNPPKKSGTRVYDGAPRLSGLPVAHPNIVRRR
jgi:hypothetical protein